MIIGLHGKKRVGKDTVYEIIRSSYPHAVRVAFADKMRESLAALFDISVKELEDLKESEAAFQLDSVKTKRSFTWREFIQRYGTEAHRDIFGQDFWINSIFPTAFPLAYVNPNDITVVTDVRFYNEARRILDLGGHIISVVRPNKEYNNDSHVSEMGLSEELVSYEIVNDGSLEQLQERVLKIIDNILN